MNVRNSSVSVPSSPGRRRFLDYLLGSSAIATLGAIFYPIFKFISPPQIVESTQNSVVIAKGERGSGQLREDI